MIISYHYYYYSLD